MADSHLQRISMLRQRDEASGGFMIAKAWDPGSAGILPGMGFKALATSSGAAAGVLGRLDGQITGLCVHSEICLFHGRDAGQIVFGC